MKVMNNQNCLEEKLQKLKEKIQGKKKLLVAFSAGVDSTFLLKVAKEVLENQLLAVTVVSSFVPQRESKEAQEFCEKEGIRQIMLTAEEVDRQEIRSNPKDRCYHCKKAIFQRLKQIAQEEGISVIAEGSNMDDLSDYRPGRKAIEELGIWSPLMECELGKEEIRMLSRKYQLPTSDKPSFACLASRFPYGEWISNEKLARVESAEEILLQMGFSQMRVRSHQDIARIELLEEDMKKILEKDLRFYIYQEFEKLGFSYITMDLKGYRTGSLNEVLNKNE